MLKTKGKKDDENTRIAIVDADKVFYIIFNSVNQLDVH